MNINDYQFVSLRGTIFIAPDGELIKGEFHAPYVSEFYGLKHTLDEQTKKKRQARFELFDKYRDQVGWYNTNTTNFIIQYYGYDRTTPYNITTSKENAYETYFNWLLEGYEVYCLRPILFTEEKGFYYPEQDSSIITRELALKEEALAIRNDPLKRELKRYYR